MATQTICDICGKIDEERDFEDNLPFNSVDEICVPCYDNIENYIKGLIQNNKK